MLPQEDPTAETAGTAEMLFLLSMRAVLHWQISDIKGNIRLKTAKNGGRNKMKGKNGEDIVIKVPRGTLVKDNKTGRVLADMVTPGQKNALLRAAAAAATATATLQQRPVRCLTLPKAGEAGIELELVLELKLLADVGLVGYPNVGKSTLLSVTTGAKPEIANYHFTTVKPNLGVVYCEEGNSFVLADIPGLIEGASDGMGLGHMFLRHVERTRLIVHVIDMSGSEGLKPVRRLFAYKQ